MVVERALRLGITMNGRIDSFLVVALVDHRSFHVVLEVKRLQPRFIFLMLRLDDAEMADETSLELGLA